MTNHLKQMADLANEFAERMNAILADSEEGRKAARAADKAARHAKHPAEPEGASLVKVFFDGDRIDGNTFAVCQPTEEFKRIRVDGLRVSKRMWKYSYERATGTTKVRSFGGMLKTLDGHGRTVTRIEVYRPTGAEIIDLTA